MNSRNIKEVELLPPSLTINNDENELDLTNFIPSINHKPPISKSSNSDLETPVRNKKIPNEKRKFI